MTLTVIEGCAVATVDATGTEYDEGHVVAEDGVLIAVGPGPAQGYDEARRVDGRGCLATPGLVNTHHHLYQWLTRGCAPDSTLFEWLVELYPMWARIDAQAVHSAAAAGLGWLALSGCTTSMDHHYVFPAGRGDLFAAEVEAARTIGIRFHPARGSMDLGESQGGLPPDHIVENIDTILEATTTAIDEHHDPSPASMTRVVVAPCSPFSVTADLLRQTADLARERGVRLHTHLCETLDEEAFCRERFGTSPTEYVEQLGWLGLDVWLAHGVHLDDAAVRRLADSGTGVAHCPSSNARLGAGIARVKDLLAAGVPVGLGVDGPASNEHGGLGSELRIALLVARLRGGAADLDGRDVLRMATMGGARCLGRDKDIGSLEVGKRADVALWDLTGLGHVDLADDPVIALVMGPPAPLRLMLVEGRTVVAGGALVTADAAALGAAARGARRSLLGVGA